MLLPILILFHPNQGSTDAPAQEKAETMMLFS